MPQSPGWSVQVDYGLIRAYFHAFTAVCAFIIIYACLAVNLVQCIHRAHLVTFSAFPAPLDYNISIVLHYLSFSISTIDNLLNK